MMVTNPAETLDEALGQVIALWAGAAGDRHSPMHTPVVTTVLDGQPSPRIMVLRAVDQHCTGLRFHTDLRSPKVAQIGAGAPVAVIGYHPEQRIQTIVRGTAHVEHVGDIADTAWATSALSSRRCYLAENAPGTQVGTATSGLPQDLLLRAPTLVESEAGRANFSVLLINVHELEWLKLTSCGNRRAVFTRSGEDWHGQWITP